MKVQGGPSLRPWPTVHHSFWWFWCTTVSYYNSTRSTIKRKKPKEHKTKSYRERERDTNDFYFDCSQTEVTQQQQDGFYCDLEFVKDWDFVSNWRSMGWIMGQMVYFLGFAFCIKFKMFLIYLFSFYYWY